MSATRRTGLAESSYQNTRCVKQDVCCWGDTTPVLKPVPLLMTPCPPNTLSSCATCAVSFPTGLQFEDCFPAFLSAAQGMHPTSWPPNHLQHTWAALNGSTTDTGDAGSAAQQGQQIDMDVKDEQGRTWRWGVRAWVKTAKAGSAAQVPAAGAPLVFSCGPNIGGFMLTNTGRHAAGLQHLTVPAVTQQCTVCPDQA
jgi:hypothetical protein